MDISDLICETINQYCKAFGSGASKTKLLKLVYLVELLYKRRYGKRLTNAEWVYYLYGPYLYNYDKIIDNNTNINIKDFEYAEDKEAQIVTIKSTYTNNDVPSDIKFLISDIVHDYGKLDLRTLLDHVYFETEPMMNAENRGEVLDFENVMPESYYKVKKLSIDKKTKKALDHDFRKRVEALHVKRH